jgi:hypothetical protein
MLRVTPPGSTYGLSTILVQWRIDDITKKFVVRFKAVDPEDYENKFAIYLNKYKNPARLNKAICSTFNANYTEPGWNTRVFMNNISAGRGADYNNMTTFINKTQQPRRAGDTRYEFGTIDTRSNSLVESFIASLINDTSIMNRWDVSPVDTVNINVAKRREGSSIIIPFVNEAAVREVYEAYFAYVMSLKNEVVEGDGRRYNGATDDKAKLYDVILDNLNINTFDLIYGKYIYDTGRDDVELDLPMYQVDMFDTEIPRMSQTYQIKTSITDARTYGTNVTVPATNADWPSDVIEGIALANIAPKTVVGITDNASVALGDVFLVTPKYSSAYVSIVTEINQYTGNIVTKSIPKVKQIDVSGNILTDEDSVTIKAVYNYNDPFMAESPSKTSVQNQVATFLANYRMELNDGDVVAIVGTDKYNHKRSTFFLVKVNKTNDVISSTTLYGRNIFYYLDYASFYAGESAIKNSIILQSDGVNSPIYTKLGALMVDDTVADDVTIKYVARISVDQTTKAGSPKFEFVHIHNTPDPKPGTTELFYCCKCRADELPATLSSVVGSNVINSEYDVMIFDTHEDDVYTATKLTEEPSGWPTGYYVKSGENYVAAPAEFTAGTYYTKQTGQVYNDTPNWIYRVVVTNATASTFRVKCSAVTIPNNYYSNDYGDALYSEAGGVCIQKGSTGFFDGDYNSIEFKWGYSALLTQAFRGQIDPRILSPVRVPAKYLFDAGFNTVVGLAVIPMIDPDVKDVIFASTIFDEDDCEDIQNNPDLIKNITYEDIDVKQAMYDLMIERNYQRIPEAKRPIGPGSGLSLHLDSCYVDINGIKNINQSFQKRFDNPNASWDIGGYTDANTGITYTWTKRIVDNLVRHCKTYTVNKPYVNQYTAMQKSEYTSIFPDVDATDWDLRELMYQSGGNSWVADTNGVVTRRSQRTLKRDSVTSDLLQESNMRTLSQLVYLLQNKLDTYLLEYDDDGVLQTMSDECNVMFNGWVGTRVQSLSIRFERDKNIDGRDIVVCYVDVTFRGLVLSIPIIVNVNRRTES